MDGPAKPSCWREPHRAGKLVLVIFGIGHVAIRVRVGRFTTPAVSGPSPGVRLDSVAHGDLGAPTC